MHKTQSLTLLAARVLLALIFLAAGANKLSQYGPTVSYMESMGVSGALLPAVIALELAGGLAILLGAFTRLAAVVLALFCLVAGTLFHRNFADPIQAAMFMKNLAIAGGFLALMATGPGALSVDSRLRQQAN
jgi:putative oxidoreductase